MESDELPRNHAQLTAGGEVTVSGWNCNEVKAAPKIAISSFAVHVCLDNATR
jgi:hypothetical protein